MTARGRVITDLGRLAEIAAQLVQAEADDRRPDDPDYDALAIAGALQSLSEHLYAWAESA